MKNRKLVALLALLKSPKVFIPIAFLIAALGTTGGLFIAFSFNKPTESQAPKVEGLTIDTSLTLDIEEMKCQSNPDSLQTKIVKPDDNKEFLTTDKIDFEAVYTYECENSPTFEFAWILDGNESAFSTDSSKASLEKLSVGEHKVKYLVKNDKIQNSAEVKFKVKEPVKVVVNPTPTPQPQPPVIPVNRPPTASIDSWYTLESSQNPSTVYPDGSDQTGNYATFYADASASDPEDGTIPASRVKWTKTVNGVTTEMYPSSSSQPLKLIRQKLYGPGNCGSTSYKITLTVTDSQGLSSSSSINITVLAPYCVQ